MMIPKKKSLLVMIAGNHILVKSVLNYDRLSYKLKSCSQDSGFDDQPQPKPHGDSWNGRIVVIIDTKLT